MVKANVLSTEGLPYHSLIVDGVELQVHLGCTPKERENRQNVRVKIEFRFLKEPKAFQSDKLSDTICFDDLSSQLTLKLESKEYNLIEHMAFDAFHVAKELAGS